MKKYNSFWMLTAALVLAACSYDDGIPAPEAPEIPVVAGNADFSRYVALGNSLTAGFSDNALFIEGQRNSFPKLMADQFALAGGGEFRVPFMNDNVGGLLVGGIQIQGPRLFFNGAGPAVLPGTPTTDITNILTGPFNNMGIPGAKSFHLVAPGYGNLAGVLTGQANPYFVRFASSPNTTVIADAVAQNPTFFSLWIGNNDVLAFATSGGVGVNQAGNLNPATYGSNDITDPNVFANVYQGLVDGLTANGAKGAVANIPYVNAIPFFTTIPHNPIPLDAATANQLNTALIGPLRQVLTLLGEGDRLQLLQAGNNNPLLIFDENLTNFAPQLTAALTAAGIPAAQAAFLGATYGQARHARNANGFRDYIPLTTQSVIGATNPNLPAPFNTFGVTSPLLDQHVLTKAEVDMIVAATDSFNQSIQAIAQAKDLIVIDVNSLLTQIASPTGLQAGSFTFKSDFVFGNTFSMDGVHLSARANAYIANIMIDAINLKHGSTLRKYDLSKFPVHYSPNLPN
jgi:hypothetical protein